MSTLAHSPNNAHLDRSNMQIAIHTNVSSVLTMPTNEFIEYHLQPLEDDGWIRQEQIVHLEDLTENANGQKIRQSVLKDHQHVIDENGGACMDPIFEGMLYHEQFMEEYRSSGYKQDSTKAHCYRTTLVEEFRKKHPLSVKTIADETDDEEPQGYAQEEKDVPGDENAIADETDDEEPQGYDQEEKDMPDDVEAESMLESEQHQVEDE